MKSPDMTDVRFIYECYKDWPVTESNPPVTEQQVIGWVNRWMHKRDGEEAAVNEYGLIQWRTKPPVVDGIVVHPLHRGKGKSKEMMRWLQEKLVSEGVEGVSFLALPGPIADMTLRGRFEHRGEGIGPKTGLPVVDGWCTKDTVI